MKDEEINELKNKLEYTNINNLMTVIFYSPDQDIHYSLICKKTDIFTKIENELFEVYPEKRDSKFLFFVNGQIIDRSKTLQENNIKNSQVILLSRHYF